VHHVGILYDQIMMHGQRNIKLHNMPAITDLKTALPMHKNGSIPVGTHHLQV